MRETVDQLRAKKRADELASERAVDYERLRDLLKSGQWKAADQETADRMCEVMGRQEDGWLRVEDIQNFPCIDLRTIDQLWVKHSRGKFGFSVQKKIWQECGSLTANTPNWEKFGEVVEWKKGDVWKIYNELTFEISAPSGHLPSPVYFKIGLLGRRWWVWVVSSPASRLADCSIE